MDVRHPVPEIRKQFTEALDDLIAQVKGDKSILAAILCGSLSHDTVWAKSDIDLVLVTTDDKNAHDGSLALRSGSVNIHSILIARTQFRKTVEGSVGNSFVHSLLAKGRLLYTHDPTIADLFEKMREIGDRDVQAQVLAAATQAVGSIYKAHKWLLTRGDLDYTALWILYAATPLARIEVIGGHMLADREVILQALELNPGFFETIYTDLLNVKKNRKNVQAALDAVDTYLEERTDALFGPVIEHLREVGEARSATEIESHFQRNFNIQGITMACEYLADRGLISAVSIPAHLTKKSNIQVPELAFVYLGEAPDAF